MVPLVPVAAGSRLIAPGRLFARLPQKLAPFVYEVSQDMLCQVLWCNELLHALLFSQC